MPKTAIRLETTPTVTVKLSPQARLMVKARCEEHATLSAQKKAIKARQDRIGLEVTDIFKKAHEGQALLDGTKLDGHGVKLVLGETSKFDKLGFMKEFGVTQEDFDKYTSTKDNKPYVKFTHPRAAGDTSDNDTE